MSDRDQAFRTLSTAALALVFLAVARLASSQPYTVLHYLNTDTSEGMLPQTELVPLGGDFYGICWQGGQHDDGTAFKITPGGAFTKIHDFDGSVDGRYPVALVDGGDGNLYGLDGGGTMSGTLHPGVFFKLTTGGTSTPLHSFASDNSEGIIGPAFLIHGSDGNFYGVCSGGGSGGYGTAFELTPGGGYTKLHDFGPFGDPGGVGANSIIDVAGELYGTTLTGGEHGYGTVFHITKAGAGFNVVHSFAQSEGGLPGGGYTGPPLVYGSDGNLYGTTSQYGTSGAGSVWRLATNGDFVVLHQLIASTDGSLVYAGLFQANDGNLYGSADTGPGAGTGVLFQVTLAGSYTPFHLFTLDAVDGGAPYSAPIQGADGALYGATYGGNSGVGVIYKHLLPPSVQSIAPTSGAATGGTALAISGTTFAGGAAVSIGGVAATGVSVVGPAEIDATTPALTAGSLNDVMVTNADTTFATLSKGFFADFLDVPQADIFHNFIETIFRLGITAGVGGGNYGRDNPVRRDQMAVFLLKAEHGSAYTPPPCNGMFPDVPCPSTFAPWIEELATEGITGGCGGGNYCPGSSVTRQQMSVFLLKTEHGSAYAPPDCAGIFDDVPCPSTFAPWVEQLFHENVTGGCSVAPPLFCPTSSNTRGQMAVFLDKTFHY